MTETKTCSFCGRELPLSEFHKSSKNPDGHQSYCKECKSELSKERAKRLKDEADERRKNNLAVVDSFLGQNTNAVPKVEAPAPPEAPVVAEPQPEPIIVKPLNLDNKARKNPNNPLADFTPRELMLELKRRGYSGTLTYTCRCDISNL